MCVDCVLASLRIAQVDPGRRTPPRGGSVTLDGEEGQLAAGGARCNSDWRKKMANWGLKSMW
jgi:hypothetical protein